MKNHEWRTLFSGWFLVWKKQTNNLIWSFTEPTSTPKSCFEKSSLVSFLFVNVFRGTISGCSNIFFGGFLEPLRDSLENHSEKWLLKEPWSDRFVVESEMVLLRQHYEELFVVPAHTFSLKKWEFTAFSMSLFSSFVSFEVTIDGSAGNCFYGKMFSCSVSLEPCSAPIGTFYFSACLSLDNIPH